MTIKVVCDQCGKELYEVIVKSGESMTFYNVKSLCPECKKDTKEQETLIKE